MQHVAALLAEIVGTSAIDPSEPAAVLGIHHDCEEQIAQICRLASDYLWRLVPRGHPLLQTSQTPTIAIYPERIAGISEYSPDDIIVSVRSRPPFDALQEVLRSHQQILVLDPVCGSHATEGGVVANVLHVGNGNLHPLICYNARIKGQLQLALALGQRILEVCVDMGGSITGEHGVGMEKIGHMAYMFSDQELQAQQDSRQVLNPQGLCNAGKIPSSGACVENRSVHHADPPILVGASPDGNRL